jgi:hypothetical protein
VTVLKTGRAASGNFHRREFGGAWGNPFRHDEILNRDSSRRMEPGRHSAGGALQDLG